MCDYPPKLVTDNFQVEEKDYIFKDLIIRIPFLFLYLLSYSLSVVCIGLR